LAILSWYITDDIVEDIDEFLDLFLLVEEFLLLNSNPLTGADSVRMSIPVLFEESMVGNVKACELDILDKLKVEEKNNLFTIFLIGTTMQDSGKRKRSNTVTCDISLIPNSSSENRID